ncbi:MAG: hypothetical protein EAX95_13020 [Candidatus Thorarchaeota archaeon]|nr:hypothetical protein [Candidatus Thorarchaeota archaeon]
MITLTVDQLEKWYRKQLSNQSKDFRKKAERSYKIVERSLKDIQDVSKGLKDATDDEEGEIGIATRFAMKIAEISDGFYVEKEITYETTEGLQNEIQRFIQELWGAGARWIKRMDKKHKGTIKQLDVHMKELMTELKRIAKLLYEFSWLKDLERIGGRIQTLKDLTFSKEVFENQIRQTRQKIDTAQLEYNAAMKAYADFSEKSNVADLLNLDEEAERIASLLRMKLNPLKKQTKKFLQHDTGVRIGPAGQKALTDYFEDPFLAIAQESEGYPGLIEGLGGLKTAIEQGKLPLKDRLARRAVEEIDQIAKGSLLEYQKKAKEVEDKRHSFADSDVYAQNERLEAAVDEARKNLEYHKNDLLRIRDDITREVERAKDFKERIQSEILESFGEKVNLQLEVSLEPLLDKCTVA